MVHAISSLTQGFTRGAQPGWRVGQVDLRVRVAEPSPQPTRDDIELSPAALRRMEAATWPMARADYIDWLRQEIAAGRYLTPDKIDFVVERLCEEIRGS